MKMHSYNVYFCASRSAGFWFDQSGGGETLFDFFHKTVKHFTLKNLYKKVALRLKNRSGDLQGESSKLNLSYMVKLPNSRNIR
jgi:hypothetical protein